MKAKNALSLVIAAGIVSTAAADSPMSKTQLEPSGKTAGAMGHIYFNVATGEKITTLFQGGESQRGVHDGDGAEIWVNDTGAQCDAVGVAPGGGGYYWNLDRFTVTFSTGYVSPARWNNIVHNWGDIEMNTVVDMVQVSWQTSHLDVDADSDSFPDGITGLMATWVFYDGYSPAAPAVYSTAKPIISMGFYSLPGYLQTTPPITSAGWVMDIDLGGSFGTSLVMEIGDNDSDLQGAAVHNARMDLLDDDSDSIPDIDPDQDGLADWGWSVQYVQPGSIDVDNADGDSDITTGIDGVTADMAAMGVHLTAPTPGYAEVNPLAGGAGEPAHNWIGNGPTAGQGWGDIFSMGTTDFPDGSGLYTQIGGFWFGGLDCGTAANPVFNAPFANFNMILYTHTANPCPADMNGDGVVGFPDVSAFVAAFQAGDMAADFNGDGVIGFPDVSAFVAAFQAGCP